MDREVSCAVPGSLVGFAKNDRLPRKKSFKSEDSDVTIPSAFEVDMQYGLKGKRLSIVSFHAFGQ